jgi:putative membrane protein
MKKITFLALLLGLVAITALVIWQGVGEIADTMAELGFGVIWLLIVFAAYALVSAYSIRLLFPQHQLQGVGPIFASIWVGGGVNTIFPVAQVGGEVVKARVLHCYGTPGPIAVSVALADTTVSALSLALWGFIGVASLFYLNVNLQVTLSVFAGVAVFSGSVIVFFVLQRIGAVGFLAKSFSGISESKSWGQLVGNAKDVDAAVREVYRSHLRFGLSIFIRLLARFIMALEIWAAAYLMGHPIGLIEAFMFRSLIATVRGVAFFVPQGFGVQEAAFIALGGLVGISPSLALSLSLASRAREILESAAGVLFWQHLEGKSIRVLFQNMK